MSDLTAARHAKQDAAAWRYGDNVNTLKGDSALLDSACTWLADCFPLSDYSDSYEDWAALSTESIAARIERHYDGGLDAFIHLS